MHPQAWNTAKLGFAYTALRETTSSTSQERGLAYGEALSVTVKFTKRNNSTESYAQPLRICEPNLLKYRSTIVRVKCVWLLFDKNYCIFLESEGFFPQTTQSSLPICLSKNSSYLKSLQNLLRGFGLGVRLGCHHRHCTGRDGFAWRPTAACCAGLWGTGASNGGFNCGSELGWRQ